MANTNPLETTLQSTSGKVLVGIGLVSLVIGAVTPFLPQIQEHLSKGNYGALVLSVIALVGAVASAISLHKDRTQVKVEMIKADVLPGPPPPG